MTLGIIQSFINEYGAELVNTLLYHTAMALRFIFVFLIGYIFACIVSVVVKRILNVGELQKTLIKYGATTTKLWESTTNFVAQYLKWYITVMVLTTLTIPMINIVFVFMGNLLWFILLAILGLILGGVSYKLVRDTLDNLGFDAELKKHKMSNALGGYTLSGILASIVRWYVILLLLGQGVDKLSLPKLSLFLNDVMAYIPDAVLGLMTLIISFLIANLAGMKIRDRKVVLSEFFAICAELVVVFFGAVMALPKFGVTNVSILEDSFKLLVAGLSLGLAIALGLGLKDSVAALSKKYEKT